MEFGAGGSGGFDAVIEGREGGVDGLARGDGLCGGRGRGLNLLADLFADFHFAGELDIDGGGHGFVADPAHDLPCHHDRAEEEQQEEVDEEGDEEAFFKEAHLFCPGFSITYPILS